MDLPLAVGHLCTHAPDPLQVERTSEVVRHLTLPSQRSGDTGRCDRDGVQGDQGAVWRRTARNRLRSRLDFEVQLAPLAANPVRRRRTRQLRPACGPSAPDWPGLPSSAGGPHAPLAAFVAGPPPPQCGGLWRGGPHAASPAPAAPRGAAPPLPPESRVGHCHTTFQLRTPRCSPPPPRIGSPGPD